MKYYLKKKLIHTCRRTEGPALWLLVAGVAWRNSLYRMQERQCSVRQSPHPRNRVATVI